MNQLLHILKYKSKAYLRQNIVFDFKSIIKGLGSLIIFGGFAVGVFYLSQNLIAYILEEVKLGSFLLHEFLSIILFIFFLSINAGNIIVSYSTLYKSGEISFLMQKPIKKAHIFLLKFLDNFFYSSSTLLLMLFSALSAYFIYYDYNFSEILIIILLAFLPFIISAGSLGVITLLIVIKLIYHFGFKKIIGILFGGYVIMMISFFKIISPVSLVNNVMEKYPDVDFYYGELIPNILEYLPNQWLSQTLYWISQDNLESSLYPLIYLNLFAIILFSLALFLGQKFYYKTWLLVQNRSSNEIKTKSKIRFLRFTYSKFLTPFSNSVFKRDLLMFLREPSQTLHFTVLFLLTFVFMGSLSSVSKVLNNNTELKLIVYLTIFIFNQFLIITIALRFIFPLMSLEGNSIWKIKSAPINTNKLLKIKILPFLILMIIISQFLSFISNRIFSFDLIIFFGIITFFTTILIGVINFGMGVLFKNYKEKNPIRLASSQGATLSFLISILVLIILAAIISVPLYNYFETTRQGIQTDFSKFKFVTFIWSLSTLILAIIIWKVSLRFAIKD